MKIEKTEFADCYIITPVIYKDFRGEYVEIYNQKIFRETFPVEFLQDDISVSYKNVLRGFHGDKNTWKLVQCLHGRFQLAIIDMRVGSPTMDKIISITLDDKTRQQVLIPPLCGNAHLCLSDMCIFHYKQSTYYDGAENQFTVSWKQFKGWAINNPILSERDKNER